jgi:DNA-binding GntR family transcriptional regulator
MNLGDDGSIGLVARQALRETASNAIRDAILDGRLKPGIRLREVELAQRLGISRAPLREAIRQLELEGLLMSTPHRGTFVMSFSAEDAREIYTLRATLEGLAIQLVSAHNSPDTLNSLQAAADRIKQAAKAGDVPLTVEQDMEFHECLCRCAKHSRLFAMWKSMATQIRAFVSIEQRGYLSLDDLAQRHQCVVDLLRQGNLDAARQQLVSDILEVGEHVAADLLKSNSQ